MRSDGSIYEGVKELESDLELTKTKFEQYQKMTPEERIDDRIEQDFKTYLASQGKVDTYKKILMKNAFRAGWLKRNGKSNDEGQ